eukprot:SAG31_NODE_982_length_10556_cov_18.203883_8_plen_586_part_00
MGTSRLLLALVSVAVDGAVYPADTNRRGTPHSWRQSLKSDDEPSCWPPTCMACCRHHKPHCCDGWHDITGALTVGGRHHVFQGCPDAGGWHHAESTDLVHWRNRGVKVRARKEAFEGFSSDDAPCSGFATVDEQGRVCVGFRQCSSKTGLKGLNPHAQPWDAPLELRCTNDSELTSFEEEEWMFPVYYYRALPYDPVRPWRDHDKMWYAAISTDGCNATTRQVPCAAGGRLDLWTSPKLQGHGADWRHVRPMITTNKTPLDSSATAEFVTSNFIGTLEGDPRGGKTRMVTNNALGAAVSHGSPIFYLGVQENGSALTDGAGRNDFAGPGEMGMLDWGGFTPNGVPGTKGTKALQAAASPVSPALQMARTLSSVDQVAEVGRRTMVAWGTAVYTFQTLPQDLTLGRDELGEVVLKQQFAPELQGLRRSTTVACSKHFEVTGSISKPPTGRLMGNTGGCANCGYITVLNYTRIGIDFDAGLAFIDTSAQTLGSFLNAGVRAGPAAGDLSRPVPFHVIVDASIIAAIFGNRTSLTVSVTPGQRDGGFQPGPGAEVSGTWVLATANNNSQRTPQAPWLLPRVHNIPPCV